MTEIARHGVPAGLEGNISTGVPLQSTRYFDLHSEELTSASTRKDAPGVSSESLCSSETTSTKTLVSFCIATCY